MILQFMSKNVGHIIAILCFYHCLRIRSTRVAMLRERSDSATRRSNVCLLSAISLSCSIIEANI